MIPGPSPFRRAIAEHRGPAVQDVSKLTRTLPIGDIAWKPLPEPRDLMTQLAPSVSQSIGGLPPEAQHGLRASMGDGAVVFQLQLFHPDSKLFVRYALPGADRPIAVAVRHGAVSFDFTKQILDRPGPIGLSDLYRFSWTEVASRAASASTSCAGFLGLINGTAHSKRRKGA